MSVNAVVKKKTVVKIVIKNSIELILGKKIQLSIFNKKKTKKNVSSDN